MSLIEFAVFEVCLFLSVCDGKWSNDDEMIKRSIINKIINKVVIICQHSLFMRIRWAQKGNKQAYMRIMPYRQTVLLLHMLQWRLHNHERKKVLAAINAYSSLIIFQCVQMQQMLTSRSLFRISICKITNSLRTRKWFALPFWNKVL